jgi:hypothetical protein
LRGYAMQSCHLPAALRFQHSGQMGKGIAWIQQGRLPGAGLAWRLIQRMDRAAQRLY